MTNVPQRATETVSRKSRPVQKLLKARKKPIACTPCHNRKIKCSGDVPCSNCTRSRTSEACTYPVRDKRLSLTESELDRLVAERVQEQQRESSPRAPHRDQHAEVAPESLNQENSQAVCARSARNPLFDDTSWFEPFQATQLPIHIGEASDSAFATRFRQAISASAQHIPRTQYASDSKILSLSNEECVWPPLARARFLIQVALRISGPIYHCIRRSEIWDGLEQHYLTQPVPASISEDTFPGLRYFSRASRILRENNERPQIENVECTLLLAMYSLLLNRRHSAYQLASSAVRQAIIIGLPQNIPEALTLDRAFREHCVRIWWSAYALDRLTSSQVGYPSSIQDDDISVNQPSDELDDEDFQDAAYLRANVALARLSKEILSSLYSRKNMHVLFAKRVQDILKKLQSWLEALPPHLCMDTERPTIPVTWLHLSFNQHVILATRPVLLRIFRCAHTVNGNSKDSTEGLLQALAEACVRSARHSYRLLSDAWIEGHFATFDYTYTQSLFSVAVVLAISSLTADIVDDYDKFILACGWIQQLSENGNFAAMEFSKHLSTLQNEILSSTGTNRFGRDLRSGTSTGPVTRSLLEENPGWSSNSQPITAEMALAEPFLQDFLLQTDLDLCFSGQVGDAVLQSLYL